MTGSPRPEGVFITERVYSMFPGLIQSLSDIVTTLGPGQNSQNIQ